MCGGGGGGGDGADLDQEDREFGQSMRPGTFRGANSMLGRFLGDNRSDQQIENDRRQTEALERGDDFFERVEGGKASVRGYRDTVAPQAGGLLDRMNNPSIGLGDVLGMGVRAAVGGPVGMVAGQVAGRAFTSMFPSTSVRMSTLGSGRGKGGTGQ